MVKLFIEGVMLEIKFKEFNCALQSFLTGNAQAILEVYKTLQEYWLELHKSADKKEPAQDDLIPVFHFLAAQCLPHKMIAELPALINIYNYREDYSCTEGEAGYCLSMLCSNIPFALVVKDLVPDFSAVTVDDVIQIVDDSQDRIKLCIEQFNADISATAIPIKNVFENKRLYDNLSRYQEKVCLDALIKDQYAKEIYIEIANHREYIKRTYGASVDVAGSQYHKKNQILLDLQNVLSATQVNAAVDKFETVQNTIDENRAVLSAHNNSCEKQFWIYLIQLVSFGQYKPTLQHGGFFGNTRTGNMLDNLFDKMKIYTGDDRESPDSVRLKSMRSSTSL